MIRTIYMNWDNSSETRFPFGGIAGEFSTENRIDGVREYWHERYLKK